MKKKVTAVFTAAVLFITSFSIPTEASAVRDAALMAEKQELSATLEDFDRLVPGIDYDSDTLIAEADSYEEALAIAEGYDAELECYSEGIATISVSGNETCRELLETAASPLNLLPPLYPNSIYHLSDVPDPYMEEDCPQYQWMHSSGFLDTQKAWELSRGEGVCVAVLDTGVEPMEEFGDRLLTGKNTLGSTEPDESDTHDKMGHGTHVAGILAACAGNGLGGAGVAPLSKIYPVKCYSDKGEAMADSVLRGVNAAMEAGVDVINLSGGTFISSPLENKTWKKALSAGIVVVAAAGNSYTDAKDYPAALPGVISVAALDSDGTLAEYSNYGDTVDIAAPGSNIWSTLPADSAEYAQSAANGLTDGDFGALSGTSMATPAVTGIVALMLSADAGIKTKGKKAPAYVKSILKRSAGDISYYRDEAVPGNGKQEYGAVVHGGADAYDALRLCIAPGKPAKPAIQVESKDGHNLVTITCPPPGGDIYYTIDGSRPTEASERYTEPFECGIGGAGRIRAITVLGGKKSAVVTYKSTFEVKPVSVSVNGGRTLYIKSGNSVRLNPRFEPENTTSTDLTYTVEGTGFSVEDGVLSCAPGTAPGTRALIRAVGDGVETSFTAEAKSTQAGIIAVKENFTLGVEENEETKKNGLVKSMNLLPLIKSNDVNTGYVITSSKPSVIKVVNDSYLEAVSKGKALITITATDGSGVKARCRVRAIMPVTEVRAVRTSTGFAAESKGISDCLFSKDTMTDPKMDAIPIAAGGKIKLTPFLNRDIRYKSKKRPDKAFVPTNKRVIYSISGNAASMITEKKGVISCSESAKIGTEFYVTATAADGWGAKRTVKFRVYSNPGTPAFASPVYDSKVKTASYESPFTFDGEPHVGVLSHLNGLNNGSFECYEVKHDGNKIARYMGRYGVDSKGQSVMAYYYRYLKPGRTTVKYKTRDGSGVSFKVKINITGTD